MSQICGRGLVVEDDRSWQEILTEILSDMGLVVETADSLQAAVVSLRAGLHRLAVVDLSLGGSDHRNQDGLKVLDAIRRQAPGCVAILFTGFATVELAVSALTEHAAYTCLRKEAFRRAEFRQLVHQALAVAPPTTSWEPDLPPSPGPAESVVANPGGAGGLALVVEDDAGWRNILAGLLAEAGQRVRLCSSYGEALGCLRREKFKLAVVDLSLASSLAPEGNQDGYRVLAHTRAAAIPTIVVSGAGTPADAERAYDEYGAFAYHEKQVFDRAAFRRTVGAVVAAARGPEGELATLTPREREVLQLLAEGLTNKEIAAALVISVNTVKRHLKSVFARLGVSTRAAAASKAANAATSL
jgi:DNA-binding NarL/FixJ family response regulator